MVSLPAVQADVQSLLAGGSSATTPSSAPPAATTSSAPPPAGTIDVENASGVSHEAEKVSDALGAKGFTKGTTATETTRTTSVVEYGTDSAAATAVADALGLTPEHDSAISAGHVRVILGKDFTMPNNLSTGSSTPTSSTGPLPSQPAPDNTGNNDADTNPMSSISGGGIPCVK
jgi:hypothetical protein